MDEPIIVVHLSVSLFKYLDETQQAIVKEAIVQHASKVIGTEKVQEIVEEVVAKQVERESHRREVQEPLNFHVSFGKRDS